MSWIRVAVSAVVAVMVVALAVVLVFARQSASAPQAQTSSAAPAPSAPPTPLRVCAASELGNMTRILTQASTAARVKVRLVPMAPFVAAQEVANGTARSHCDAFWFGSDTPFGLYPSVSRDLTGSTPIMSSPVVLAVRSSVADRLGWANGSATWQAIALAAQEGRFTFAMTSPATADAGLSGLFAAALATATARGDAALQAGRLPATVSELTGLFHGQTLTAPNSSTLLSEYRQDLEDPGPGLPDGIIDHEAELITLQAEAPPAEPLTLVYPSNGVVESDYPLSILKKISPAARHAYQRLVRYLTSPAVQQQIVTTTHRRPVVRLAQANDTLPSLKALAVPRNPATIQALINDYFDRLRTPGQIIYVLDTSRSMAGKRLSELKRALGALTGAEPGLAEPFTDFHTGEKITFLPCNYYPGPTAGYTVSRSHPGPVLTEIRGYIGRLKAHGQTAIYDGLVRAYQRLRTPNGRAPNRIDSIVLITDGENTNGRKLSAFLAYYYSLPASSAPAPVYTIAVGEADVKQLRTVASVTGGAFFDLVREPLSSLATIIEDIRGYQ